MLDPVASITTSGRCPSQISQQLFDELVARTEQVRNAHFLFHKVQPALLRIDDDDLAADQLHELQHGQPNRTGPDDHARLVLLDRRAIHGMAADGQRFDQGELLEVQLRRGMQLARRQREQRPQPAVAVDAEDLQLLAAVRMPAAARVAIRVVDVRLDRAAIAGLDVLHVRADGDDLDAEFMTRNPRVAKERHLAEIPGQIGPADADVVDAHDRVIGTGLAWFGNVDLFPVQRRFELECFHGQSREWYSRAWERLWVVSCELGKGKCGNTEDTEEIQSGTEKQSEYSTMNTDDSDLSWTFSSVFICASDLWRICILCAALNFSVPVFRLAFSRGLKPTLLVIVLRPAFGVVPVVDRF